MNIRDKLSCRVCGYKHESFPWGEDGKSPTFEICICCGVEFGYEDSTQKGIETYRKLWKDDGYPWFKYKQKPDNWDPIVQVKSIPTQFK